MKSQVKIDEFPIISTLLSVAKNFSIPALTFVRVFGHSGCGIAASHIFLSNNEFLCKFIAKVCTRSD